MVKYAKQEQIEQSEDEVEKSLESNFLQNNRLFKLTLNIPSMSIRFTSW